MAEISPELYRYVTTGPRDAKIMIVGEAPDEIEHRMGRPFEGTHGDVLSRSLSRAKISLSSCYRSNVVHKPAPISHYIPGNRLDSFVKGTGQIDFIRGVMRLKEDIATIKPNLIIGLGEGALKVLTSKTGIAKWRGSILESTLVPKQKVICTYTPAYVSKMYDYKVIFEFDFKRCRTESETSSIVRPVREFFLHNVHYFRDADGLETERPMRAGEREFVAREMVSCEWLAVDIECWYDETNGKWKLACVGFSDRAERALVIHNDGPESINLIRQLLLSPTKKIYQNGLFDYTVLRDEGLEPNGFDWDTMLAHHSLFPESASGGDETTELGTSKKRKQSALAKGLAFQTSFYTREPFYKDDGKVWKLTNDLKMFWKYNALDACVTREIRDVQAEEMKYDTRA